MTLKQLEAFYLAASLGSFALAAERVRVTQSSLSKRIAELEDVVGAALFDRTGKRARLTEAGQRLMPVVANMLQLKDSIRTQAHNATSLSGTCRFGISEFGAVMWLPRFVARIRKEHPDLMLQPYVDLGRRLERQVSRGELDFAIAVGPAVDEHVASDAFSQIKIAWVASPSRFRQGTTLDARELGRHTIITMTEGSAMTRAFDHWADEQGLKVQRVLASNSLAAIAGLVEADIGISFLPEAYIEPWTRSGRLVTLPSRPPLPSLRYCFLHRQDDTRAVVKDLHRLVIEEADYGAPSTPGPAKKKKRPVKKRL